MKFAIHLSTYQKSYNEDLVPLVEQAAKTGYKAVEIPVLSELCFNPAELKAVADFWGMDILCSTGLSPETDVSSTDAKIRQKGIDYMKERMDIAYKLNSKQFTGVTYSPWGVLQSKGNGKQNIENSINSIQIIADYAKSADVLMGLEILNRYEGYMINTVAEGLDFIKKVDRDNVKLHFDTFHAHIEENDIYEAIKLGASEIIHVHFCDNTRGAPLTGQVHWDKVIKGLTEINYDRYVSIENFVNTNCEVGDSAMIWRQVDESGYKVAERAYENMKKLFGGKYSE